MKELNIVKPEEYFLEISPLKKHPDFSKIKTIIPDYDPAETSGIKRGNAYQHTKTGFREDLGLTLRSNWEANFARILTAYKIKFDFEPTVFAFPIKKRNQGVYS
jgi:hypothetical protein